MASHLGCLSFIDSGRGCHRSLLCLPFSTVRLQSLILQQKILRCPLQSKATWLMNFQTVSGYSRDHEHPLVSISYHRLQTLVWSPVSVHTKNTMKAFICSTGCGPNMTHCSNMAYRHTHNFRHRPRISTWPPAATPCACPHSVLLLETMLNTTFSNVSICQKMN